MGLALVCLSTRGKGRRSRPPWHLGPFRGCTWLVGGSGSSGPVSLCCLGASSRRRRDWRNSKEPPNEVVGQYFFSPFRAPVLRPVPARTRRPLVLGRHRRRPLQVAAH